MMDTLANVVDFYFQECREQPARLAAICHAYRQDARIRQEIADLKRATVDAPVLWLGMGASYCAGISGAVRLVSCGRLSFSLEASEWLHYGDGTQNQHSAKVLVTSSGESAELVRLCEQSKMGKANRQCPTILVANEERSSCWSHSQIRFPIMAGPELANATKTFTNSTAACVILASELSGQEWEREADVAVESFSNSFTRLFEQRAELARFCEGATSIELVGRGAALAGASMGALCIREMTGIRAGAHSGGAFRHGPLLDVDRSHVAIIFALGKTADLSFRLADDCVARGGRVILVGTCERIGSDRLLTCKVDPVPDGWEAITSILLPQALTAALIECYGSKFVHICTTTE